jgi:hypothetical protein
MVNKQHVKTPNAVTMQRAQYLWLYYSVLIMQEYWTKSGLLIVEQVPLGSTHKLSLLKSNSYCWLPIELSRYARTYGFVGLQRMLDALLTHY